MWGPWWAKDCVLGLDVSHSRRVGGFCPLRTFMRQRWLFFFFLVLWIFGSERVDWSWAGMHLSGEHVLFGPSRDCAEGHTSTRPGLICCNSRLGLRLVAPEILRVIGNDVVGHLRGIMPLSMMCWVDSSLPDLPFEIVLTALRTISAVRYSIDPNSFLSFFFFIRFCYDCMSTAFYCI